MHSFLVMLTPGGEAYRRHDWKDHGRPVARRQDDGRWVLTEAGCEEFGRRDLLMRVIRLEQPQVRTHVTHQQDDASVHAGADEGVPARQQHAA